MISKKAFLICELIEQHPDIRISRIPVDIPFTWSPLYSVYLDRGGDDDFTEIIGQGYYGKKVDGLSKQDLREIFRTAAAEWHRKQRRNKRDANGEDRDVVKFERYLGELQDV